MKRYLTLLVLILIFVTKAEAQKAKIDDADKGLPANVFRRVLNQQFTNLITGQTKNSIGNFAAFDIKDAEVSFAGNCLINSKTEGKKISVLTVKASGGITDGIFEIFDNNTLNTQVALDLQLNFLRPTNNALLYYDTSAQAYFKKQKQIMDEDALRQLAIRKGQPKRLLVLEQAKLEGIKTRLQTEIQKEKDADKKDSLLYDVAKMDLLITQVKNKINTFPSDAELTHDAENLRSSQLKTLRTSADIKIYGFRLGWFSVGYKAHNNKFKYFDPKLAFGSQVADTTFVTHEGRFQYSFYNWTKDAFRSFFFDAGVAILYSDNFATLTKQEVSETTQYGPATGARAVTKKYNAYSGDYRRDLAALRLYTDYYKFLFNDNQAALHGSAEFKAQKHEKPLWNATLGFLVSFKNTKDESVLNAELYYNFLDIFKTSETTHNLFERNSIGIRFAVPITFKN